ncbi:MAG: hypothetical protein SGILL_007549 [Bacillariaceae sp.]
MPRFLSSVLLVATAAVVPECTTAFAPNSVHGRQQQQSTTFSLNAAASLIPGEIDTVEAFKSSDFPISQEDLIKRAKDILKPEIGIGTKDGGDCLAEDFQFCAAVVGPIGREAYLNALGTFSLEDSFDINQNMFGFTVSPVQPNRVYWFSNANATQTAEFAGQKTLVEEQLVFPPQVFHMDFSSEGKVKEFGFYTVDRQYGNTGGLGGAFGFFYGVGKPLPFKEARPFKPSFRYRMLQGLGRLAEKLNKKKSAKKDE